VITLLEGDIVINRDDVKGSTASAKESELKNLLAEYFEVSDDLSAPEEITKNINKLNGVIDTSRGVVNKGTYSAEAEAVDKAGRKSSVSFVFKVTGAEVKTYPELKSFGINGQELKENGYAAYDDTTLTLSGVPDKATVYYAKDDYTGAQMKYKGTVLSGNTLSVEKGYTYTIMLKLKDKSIHIYHVIAR